MAKDRKIDMVILGLLSHENLSGYDIKKRMDGPISFFWKGSFGSIYPSLNSMEQEGLIVKVKQDESMSKREKILYQITDAGTQYLTSWLMETKAVNDLKYETLLKLFFGGVVGKEISLQNILSFEQQIKEELHILQFYQQNLSKVKEEKDHIYFYLTLTFGIETYEGYLRWCEEAKKILG